MRVVARARRLGRRLINIGRVLRGYPDKRRTLPRLLLFELLRPATPAAAVDHDGVRYIVNTTDRGAGRVTYMTGLCDEDLMTETLERLTREMGRDVVAGRVFVDVGANMGTSSIPAVHRYGARRAIAFEPALENFRILAANIAINGLGDRIEARQVAISDSAGTAQLELAPRNWGDHRIRAAAGTATFDAYDEKSRGAVDVALVPLDDALEAAGVALDEVGVLWVDTQGHEGHVLTGAQRLLATGIPVVCEYWPYALRRAGGLEMFESIVARSFTRIVDVRADEVIPAANVGELQRRYPHERYTDLLLIP